MIIVIENKIAHIARVEEMPRLIALNVDAETHPDFKDAILHEYELLLEEEKNRVYSMMGKK